MFVLEFMPAESKKLEGLMMGTRSGSVDPGIFTYLMRQGGISAQRLDEILNKESGCSESRESPATCGKFSPLSRTVTNAPNCGRHLRGFLRFKKTSVI
jgi:hypothetical protein